MANRSKWYELFYQALDQTTVAYIHTPGPFRLIMLRTVDSILAVDNRRATLMFSSSQKGTFSSSPAKGSWLSISAIEAPRFSCSVEREEKLRSTNAGTKPVGARLTALNPSRSERIIYRAGESAKD